MRYFWILTMLLVLPGRALAESCDTNCHDQCRVSLGIGSFIEPTCHAKCETAKQAACRGLEVPNIPLTPLEQIKAGSVAACSSVFQTITSAVIAQCSNWDGRLDDQYLIDNAANLLKSRGIINDSDLDRVQVRWCPLNGAHGMAPESRRIYLDVGLKQNPLATAKTLAHEIVHLRQYGSEGSENFKCNYSRQYLECNSCQDRGNRFEREAYDYEDQIEPRLMSVLNGDRNGTSDRTGSTSPNPQPDLRFPPGIVMQNCGCWGFNGTYTAPEPRCQSGAVTIVPCQGMCQMGGAPFGYVCQ